MMGDIGNYQGLCADYEEEITKLRAELAEAKLKIATLDQQLEESRELCDVSLSAYEKLQARIDGAVRGWITVNNEHYISYDEINAKANAQRRRSICYPVRILREES